MKKKTCRGLQQQVECRQLQKICCHQSAKKEPGETGDKAAEQFTENIACIPPVEPRLYAVATGKLSKVLFFLLNNQDCICLTLVFWPSLSFSFSSKVAQRIFCLQNFASFACLHMFCTSASSYHWCSALSSLSVIYSGNAKMQSRSKVMVPLLSMQFLGLMWDAAYALTDCPIPLLVNLYLSSVFSLDCNCSPVRAYTYKFVFKQSGW